MILKSSSGMDIPGRDVPREDVEALRNIEDKIYRAERRLREINELVWKNSLTLHRLPESRIISVTIFI